MVFPPITHLSYAPHYIIINLSLSQTKLIIFIIALFMNNKSDTTKKTAPLSQKFITFGYMQLEYKKNSYSICITATGLKLYKLYKYDWAITDILECPKLALTFFIVDFEYVT